MEITEEQIDIVTKHYIIAAVWADCREGTHPNVPKVEAAVVRKVCERFMRECQKSVWGDLFAMAMSRFEHGYGTHPDAGSAEAAFGHDFWLTRQHHGVGFWDRRELEVIVSAEGGEFEQELGALLTAEAYRFGECYPEQYRGWFYFHENTEKVLPPSKGLFL